MSMKTIVAALSIFALAFSTAARPAAAEDAKTILEEAGTTLKGLEALSFTAELTPTGAAAEALPHITGKVIQAKAKDGLKMNVKGSFKDETGELQEFQIIAEGEKVASLNAAKKEITTGRMPDAMMLINPAAMLVMQRMGSNDPFEHEVDEKLTLEAEESINGVPCHVIRVDYEDKRAGMGRFFIGKADHVLRRVDRVRGEGDEEGKVTLVTSDLKTNPKIDADTFSMAAPDGYKEIKFKAPRPERGGGLLKEGDVAPDFTLNTPEGKEVSLKKDLAGKVVFIDFWATWCGPCKMVMPDIHKLYETFNDNKNAAIYGISTFERGGDPVAYMKGQKFTYGLLVKGDKAAAAYKVQGIPTIYVIGKDGKVIYAESGAAPDLAKTMTGIIKDALGE